MWLGSCLMDMCPCLGGCNQVPGSTEAIFGKKPTSFFVSGHPNLRSTAEETLVSAKKAEAKVMTESDR